MTRDSERKERHSGDPKSSVKAPAKKAGGGGRYTLGKVGEIDGGSFFDKSDPNFDPDEKRIDPNDGVAYKFEQVESFYKGKFTKQAIAEYWEYECTPIRKRREKVKEGLKGPTVAESVRLGKLKYVPKAQPGTSAKHLSAADLESNGPLAKEVASVIPYFPYKKLDKFYDVQGLMKYPKLFNAVCAVFAKRFRKKGVTKLAGFEARGFLFAAITIKLGVPFVMLRKDGKLPDSIKSSEYTKEYEGSDTICVQNGVIVGGDKVALMDDLMATGGTLCAGIELVKALKAEVTECAALIEIKDLNGRDKCMKAGAQSVWAFLTDELLTTKAEISANYKDDGK